MFDFDDDAPQSKVQLRDISLTYDDLCNLAAEGRGDYDRQSAQIAREQLFKVKTYLNGKGNRGMAELKIFDLLYIQNRTGFRYNLRADRWERPGDRPRTTDDLLGDFEHRFDLCLAAPEKTQGRFIDSLASAWGFDPVKDYLQSLYGRYSPETFPQATRLAEVLFGQADPFYQRMLEAWLVGAVKRVLKPGCEFHLCLILKGAQGCGKTSFFKLLAGPDYFATLHSHMKDADRMRLTASAWIAEYGEFEATFKAKEVSALKAEISESNDRYRPLYSNTLKETPRRFIYGASTNEDAVLRDPTGNRRFPVITVTKRLDRDWLTSHRDDIWAYAIWLYQQAPNSCMLTEAEETELNNRNAEHLANPYLDAVVAWHVDRLTRDTAPSHTTDNVLNGILYKDLGIPPERVQSASRHVKSAMESLGWEPCKIGKVRGYQRPRSQA